MILLDLGEPLKFQLRLEEADHAVDYSDVAKKEHLSNIETSVRKLNDKVSLYNCYYANITDIAKTYALFTQFICLSNQSGYTNYAIPVSCKLPQESYIPVSPHCQIGLTLK